MLWLNADLRTRMWKLHREGCRFCRPRESDVKGVGTMRGAGGWFSFETVEEAHAFYEAQNDRYVWQPCKTCKPDKPQLGT